MMQSDADLLLDTINAITQWLEQRMAQDAILKATLTHIKHNIHHESGQYAENANFENKEQSKSNDNNEKLAKELIEQPHEEQPHEETVTHSPVIPASPEQIAALQAKWTTQPVVSAEAVTFNKISLSQYSGYPLDALADRQQLKQIQQRLILNAEACCLQIEHCEEPDAPVDKAWKQLVQKADALGMQLWVLNMAPSLCKNFQGELAEVGSLYSLCVDSSQSLIELIGLLDDINQGHNDSVWDDYFEGSLKLIAEAQSMLKIALEKPPFAKKDPDQIKLFRIACNFANQRNLYIPHLSKKALDTQVNPGRWRDLKNRIEAFNKHLNARKAQRQNIQSQQKVIKNIQGQICYHWNRIQKDGGTDNDWQRIANALTQWSQSGLDPDDPHLKTTLEPITTVLPAPAENESQQLINDFINTWDTEEEDNPEPTEAASSAIQQVADWLRGCTVVFIGGDERQTAKNRLMTAFHLKEVIWFHTRSNDSIEPFKTAIRRKDVVLVILAIRWASHSYGGIRSFCQQMEKPFVRLPAGYNPERVAHEVINQASEAFNHL